MIRRNNKMTKKSEAEKEVDRLYAICGDLDEQLRIAEEELKKL
jgi:hypothetical protein